jgi:hypothetical protein
VSPRAVSAGLAVSAAARAPDDVLATGEDRSIGRSLGELFYVRCRVGAGVRSGRKLQVARRDWLSSASQGRESAENYPH